MKPIGSLIPLDKAMKICFNEIKEIDSEERIPLGEATGRVVSQDIVSSVNVPPFARSAMDGYAVLSQNTFGAGQYEPVKLKCLEKIHAGGQPSFSIKSGECSQIATGAMVPEGADSVVMVEHTELEGEDILIYKPVYPGQHISPAGEDVKLGDIVLRREDVLSPARIGVLAALGLCEVKVFNRPSAVIIPTGNEVRPLGSKLEEGQIYDVNSHTLQATLNLHGAVSVIHKEIVEDEIEKVEEAIKLYEGFDFIIFSGGSSVGERDVLIEAIKKHGEVLFHGIAVKPGKPTLFGRINKSLVFGMPGNPASCLSNAYIMLVPLIRKMARLPGVHLNKVTLPLSKRIVSTLGRHQFLTVKIISGEVEPAFKSSGAITSLSSADGYIEIPALVDLIEKGEIVEVILF
ncbi:MAG TPA: molybdopterin molybdotransferase MoeA [Candidatus Eremiobacteraeota bacterium]|nr:MAG: Molybdopterin molybdenumtransferase [bacterium ADurb.Bin363]HPZ08897.1 molybdopterin molybdotransferase MoeA [Candidatus Eremiobacteraeota bacterium]